MDSSHIVVCKNIRITRNKTFEALTARGHSSVGWFYGLKLHIIINDQSEIVAIKITPGNIDDQTVFEEMTLKTNLKGKCYGDKSYLSKILFKKLYGQGLQIITGIKKNMKNHLLLILDKIML